MTTGRRNALKAFWDWQSDFVLRSDAVSRYERDNLRLEPRLAVSADRLPSAYLRALPHYLTLVDLAIRDGNRAIGALDSYTKARPRRRKKRGDEDQLDALRASLVGAVEDLSQRLDCARQIMDSMTG